MKILGLSSFKTVKGERLGILTGIIYLVPADGFSPSVNLCPGASRGCREACLFTAGRGIMRPVIEGRRRKTALYLDEREEFFALLRKDIHALVRKAKRENMTPAVRFDGTSDTGEGVALAREFPDVEWYDYTKVANRFSRDLPANYSLTFSRSESNEKTALRLLRAGRNVAVVFRGHLPEMWEGSIVIDGDKSDARFLDPVAAPGQPGYVVGLTEKGLAKKDATGFVVEPGAELVGRAV